MHNHDDVPQPRTYHFNPQEDGPVTEDEYADILFELLKLKSEKANLFTAYFSDHGLTSWQYDDELETLAQQRKFMEHRLHIYFAQQDARQQVGRGFTQRSCPLADMRDAMDDTDPPCTLKKRA